MKGIDRLLDLVGTAAIGVVTMAGAGVAVPHWLAIAAGVIAYASGKASAPGVPFMAKKPPVEPPAP